MRHLNEALVIYIVVGLVMLAITAAIVRYLLYRKQKRKKRGRSHEIDMFRERRRRDG